MGRRLLMIALVFSGLLYVTSGVLDFPHPTIILWPLGFIVLLAFSQVLRVVLSGLKRNKSKTGG